MLTELMNWLFLMILKSKKIIFEDVEKKQIEF